MINLKNIEHVLYYSNTDLKELLAELRSAGRRIKT